jgi:hypothetical protein
LQKSGAVENLNRAPGSAPGSALNLKFGLVDAAGPVFNMLTNPLPQDFARRVRASGKDHPIGTDQRLNLDAADAASLQIGWSGITHKHTKKLQLTDLTRFARVIAPFCCN